MGNQDERLRVEITGLRNQVHRQGEKFDEMAEIIQELAKLIAEWGYGPNVPANLRKCANNFGADFLPNHYVE